MLKVIKYISIIIISMLIGASILAIGSYEWYFNSYDTPEYEHFGKWPLPVKKEIPVWEKKVSLDGESIKIGLITDTHLDSKRININNSSEGRYIPDKYIKVFENFKKTMDIFEPEFIIHLGDVIEGTHVPVNVGMEELKLVKQEIDKVGKPVYWAIGNHDLRSVARRRFQQALEIDYINKVIDNGPYRFIIFDANYHKKGGAPQNPIAGDYVPGFVSKENMAWLEEKLKTDKHVYIFMHHSLVPFKYTSKNPVANKSEVRSLLSKYNVEAAFYGHIERRYFGIHDGVKYYSFPGIKKSPRYPGAYYTMTLEEGKPIIDMFYIDPLTSLAVKTPFFDKNMMVNPSDKKEIIKNANGEKLSRECERHTECGFTELCNGGICVQIKDLK